MILVTAAEATLIADAIEAALEDQHWGWSVDDRNRLGALFVRLSREAKAEHARAAADLARAARRGPLVGVKQNSPARSLIRDRGPRRGKR